MQCNPYQMQKKKKMVSYFVFTYKKNSSISSLYAKKSISMSFNVFFACLVDGTSGHDWAYVYMICVYSQIAFVLCLLNDLNVINECVTCNFNYLFKGAFHFSWKKITFPGYRSS